MTTNRTQSRKIDLSLEAAECHQGLVQNNLYLRRKAGVLRCSVAVAYDKDNCPRLAQAIYAAASRSDSVPVIKELIKIFILLKVLVRSGDSSEQINLSNQPLLPLKDPQSLPRQHQ